MYKVVGKLEYISMNQLGQYKEKRQYYTTD